MAASVYFLCALLSLTCVVFLSQAYKKTKSRMLFWSSVGFFGFALNNILLFVDLVVLSSDTDLSVIRTIPAFLGVLTLIYGFIKETV